MHRLLVVLSCIIFTMVINEAWLKLPISVDENADELTRLTEEFLSLKPAAFQNQGPLVLCQFIDECCVAEDRFQAISFMVSAIVNAGQNKNPYSEVINKCISSTDLKGTYQSCPSLHKLISPLITEQDKSMVIQYMSIVMSYFAELNNLITHVYESCNDEEIHALLCLSNTKLVKTCVKKILQENDVDNGYEANQEFIEDTKQILMDLNQELFQLIGKNKHTD